MNKNFCILNSFPLEFKRLTLNRLKNIMEENQSYLAFLDIWHVIMWYLFLASVGIAVLVFIIYKIRYLSAGSLKKKYDIASQSEIKTYLRVNYILASGIFFLLNMLYDDTVALSEMWLFIRMFISLCFATLHIYIAYLIFKYYYPRPLDKKLKKLRYTPRINPNTGNKMKLLGEDEEDVYLDEGMQAEEDAFSVDYDVWIDPATEETIILKYKGHLNALECDRCGFQTLKLQKEEVLTEPTDFADGEIEKEYKCAYCGRIKRKTVNLTKTMDRNTDGSRIIDNPLADKQIESIKMEIHNISGGKRIFEFQNVDQAKKFLDEFDFEKVS